MKMLAAILGLAAVIVARSLAAAPVVPLQPASERASGGASGGASAASVPTFSGDVAKIIYANCSSCHRPGQAAPFSLLSYDDVQKRGRTIVSATTRRYMPPWHAARADGFPELVDERRLSDADLDTLSRWVAGGMPIGDPRKIPTPPSFPAGWALGVPDLILRLPRSVMVPADGPDLYRNIAITVDLPDDKWITAVDFEPSARSVVHHALFFTGPVSAVVSDNDILPGLNLTARIAQGRTGGAGAGPGTGAGTSDASFGGIGGWVPGMTPRFYPEGIAQFMPKHSNIVVQLHLHPSGKEEREEGQLAVYFAPKTPAKSLVGVQVPPMFGYAMGIDIPAGEKQYTIHDTFELPVAATIYGARGHAHYLARDMKLTATLPDGSTKGLLWIKDWDFGWQDSYFFKTPMSLPKGTKLDATITYDNSESNPRNPSAPPKEVRWGRESFDEMGSLTALVAVPLGNPDADTLRQSSAQHFREQLVRLFLKR